jgi:hypothetical protein
VLYEGKTEELKLLIKMGATLIEIVECLHYSSRRSGKDLFGEALELFDRIKLEGQTEGNEGKRSFGKLCGNSSYGMYVLNWLSYNISKHDSLI